MVFSIKRLVLPLGLSISLGSAFTPLGCGSSGEAFAPVGPAQGDAEVPAPIAQRLTACAREHRDHLRDAQHSVSFDVALTNDGEVDSVAVEDSTLGDQDLEACMANALRALSTDALPLRRSGSAPRGPVAPESRALLGQEEALACLASPPCLLTVGFLIGVAYVAVQIYVHAASQSSTAKPKPRTAPTTEPIATAVPTATTVSETERCKKVKQECIEYCTDTTLPTPDYGFKFFNCKNHCLERHGCPQGS